MHCFFILRTRRPPKTSRTITLLSYSALFRSIDFHFAAPVQGQLTACWCDAWRVQRSLKVNGFCVAEDEILFPKGLRERRYRIAIAESRELPWFGHGKNGDRPKEQGPSTRESNH